MGVVDQEGISRSERSWADGGWSGTAMWDTHTGAHYHMTGLWTILAWSKATYWKDFTERGAICLDIPG